MGKLRGKVVLVTGASAGIGRAAALQLAEAGARVFAGARRLDRLEAVAAEGRLLGWQIESVQLDVTDEASIGAAAERIAAATGGHGVDILVNNAGYGQLGPLEEVPIAAWRQQFETNFFGMIAVIQAFLPAMRARRGGRIINMSSMGGRVIMPFGSPYTATKFAIEGISDALRVELAPWDIKVVLIEPGPILTEFGGVADGLLPGGRTAYASSTPFLRVLKATKGGFSPAMVGRTVARAAAAPRPRARYASPWYMAPLLSIGRLLPAPLIDGALKQTIRIVGQRFAAPEAAAGGTRAGAAEHA